MKFIFISIIMPTSLSHPSFLNETLGSYLVSREMITESELDVALCEQRRNHRLLGDILLELGFVKEETFYPLLAQFLKYPYVNLHDYKEGEDPPSLLWKNMHSLGVLIFQKKGSQLHIAMADPDNVFLKNQIRNHIGKEHQAVFYLAPASAITAYYQKSQRSSPKEGEQSIAFLMEDILTQSVIKNASDIHFIPELKSVLLYYRVDGLLQKQRPLHSDHWQRLLVYLKLRAKLDIAETRHPQDGRFECIVHEEQIHCRLSVIPTIHAESVVIRLLRKERGVLTLGQLGFSGHQLISLKSVSQHPQGLFLIAGPTGSGKTTTLYSLLSEMEAGTRNIVTVEDPVEYIMPGIRQSEIQPGGMKISQILRSLLRHDPDVIYISEIRDAETAHLAVQASLTGHLVLATLHASDLSSIPLRLKELNVDPLSLTPTLVGMMTQRLIRKYCPVCKGGRCSLCHETGYGGRLVLAEMKMVIGKNKTVLPLQNPTLWQQAQSLVASRVTSFQEVVRVLGNPDPSLPLSPHIHQVANVVSF